MIYVDDPMKIGGRFDGWCHMWSSLTDISYEAAVDELHDMATKIGISLKHFQQSHGISGDFPHYDISPKHRRKALANGAAYKRLREWVADRPRWQANNNYDETVWQGTEEEAQAIIDRAEMLSKLATDAWHASKEPHKLTEGHKVGDWVCEVTSAAFRNEPAIYRVGRIVKLEDDPTYKEVPIYTIQMLHGPTIRWANCLMVAIPDEAIITNAG